MDALNTRIDNLEQSINNVVVNLSGSVNNLQNNINGLAERFNFPKIKKTIYSYANSLDDLVRLTYVDEDDPNLVEFSILKHLVQPNTDTKLSEGNIISVIGASYGVAFDETYTIHNSNGDNLQFSGLYANTGTGTNSADSKVKFCVTAATGVFEGSFEVEVEYTSNIYKSRIITVYSQII